MFDHYYLYPGDDARQMKQFARHIERTPVLDTVRQYNNNAIGSSECYSVSMNRVLDAYSSTVTDDYYYNNRY